MCCKCELKFDLDQIYFGALYKTNKENDNCLYKWLKEIVKCAEIWEMARNGLNYVYRKCILGIVKLGLLCPLTYYEDFISIICSFGLHLIINYK